MYVAVVETLRKKEKRGFLSPPIPSFNGIYKCIIFFLNINMKCWNSTFNTQGSKIIIVVIQVGAMKIFVVTMEVFKNQY